MYQSGDYVSMVVQRLRELTDLLPLAVVAVPGSGLRDSAGEAVGVGERTPLALVDAAASGRMAVGEALTNIAAARIQKLPDVKLSANWMAAAAPVPSLS